MILLQADQTITTGFELDHELRGDELNDIMNEKNTIIESIIMMETCREMSRSSYIYSRGCRCSTVDLEDTWSVWRILWCHVNFDLKRSGEKADWRPFLPGWLLGRIDLVLPGSWEVIGHLASDEVDGPDFQIRLNLLAELKFVGLSLSEEFMWWDRFIHPQLVP